jgi:tight adherence protein B
MTLLAGLAVGVFVYFLVGYATGYTPEIKIRRFRRRAQISNRQLWLNQAGVAVTPRQFIAGSVAVGTVAFVAIVAVTGAPLVALVPAAGVAALPRAYFARRRTAHLQRVQAAWPDGLRDVIASIAAGRSLSQALNALAASGPARFKRRLRASRCCRACWGRSRPSRSSRRSSPIPRATG